MPRQNAGGEASAGDPEQQPSAERTDTASADDSGSDGTARALGLAGLAVACVACVALAFAMVSRRR